MSNPIPAAPKNGNPLAPKVDLSKKSDKQKRVYTPPEHLTRRIGDEFPALKSLGTTAQNVRRGVKR